MQTVSSLEVLRSHAIYTNPSFSEKPIKIPSQMYPLTGTMEVFSYDNTLPFPLGAETNTIRQVFDATEVDVGYCYQNTQRILDALAAAGVKNAVPYAGWLFVGDAVPTHHSFVVVDGKHIIDPLIRFDRMNLEAYANEDGTKTPDSIRGAFTDEVIEMMKRPHSEVMTFGQTSPLNYYVAAKCKPSEAVARFRKLMTAFPKHPSYQNIRPDGTNKTQTLFYEKQGKDMYAPKIKMKGNL